MPQVLSINFYCPVQEAMHPLYSDERSRVDSFQRWPLEAYRTPAQMADAGFFYKGYADIVTCFQCGGELQNWHKLDPWTEHAKAFGEECRYIRAVKGNEYVENVINRPFEVIFPEVVSLAAKKCMVCKIAERNVCAMPCGHKALCYKCGGTARECPICHVVLTAIIRLVHF